MTAKSPRPAHQPTPPMSEVSITSNSVAPVVPRNTHARRYIPINYQDDVESIELYKPNGYHPIVIGDYLGEYERFQVWHKLGHGAYGTVWLCRDLKTEKWRAVKVLRADISEKEDDLMELKISDRLSGSTAEQALENHIALPLEHFWQEGPNGRHLCFVMPLLGRSISRVWLDHGHDPSVLRDICFQLVRAMEFLHSRNVCHNDFRSSNVLFQTTLGDLSDEEMADLVGEPQVDYIYATDQLEEGSGPHAPAYATIPFRLEEIEAAQQYNTDQIAIVDFSVASEASKPLSFRAIPEPWAAPELCFGGEVSKGSDIWALACTMGEVVIGETPFTCMGELDPGSLEDALGPLPEPYRSVLIEKDLEKSFEPYYTEKDVTKYVAFSGDGLQRKRQDRLKACGSEDYFVGRFSRATYQPKIDYKNREDESEEDGKDSVVAGDFDRDKEESQIGELEEDSAESDIHAAGESSPKPYQRDNDPKIVRRQFPLEALPGFVELLREMFKYVPEERTPAKRLLDHRWFEGRNQRRQKPETKPTPTFDDIIFEDVQMDDPVDVVVAQPQVVRPMSLEPQALRITQMGMPDVGLTVMQTVLWRVRAFCWG